jgi:hypothetical protein
MTDILTKLGITESEFRELIERFDRKPYGWVGETVRFGHRVKFDRCIEQPAGCSGGSFSLPGGSWMPTSDIASWASGQAQVKQSSSGVPSPRWIEWLFDDTTDEFIVAHFTVPSNYGGSPILRVKYKCASATSGTVAFEARVCAYTADQGTDADADAYASVNAAGETVPGTAGYESYLDIPLTNDDAMEAGDEVNIALNRDVSADSVTGDVEVRGCEFRYSGA